MMSLNVQPRESQVLREDGSLDVVNIWHSLQGEGPFAGHPAIFVRLSGCNLDCSCCDTDYTGGRRLLTLSDLMDAIQGVHSSGTRLLVLTGGEPFRQNFVPLVLAIQAWANWRVQVETNGTLWIPQLAEGGLFQDCNIVCSPKTPSIHPKMAASVLAYKYILDADHVDPTDGLPTQSLGFGTAPPARPAQLWQEVFVQPLDEGDMGRNARHVWAATQSCLKYGYRLSLQLHKIVGLS